MVSTILRLNGVRFLCYAVSTKFHF
ncbi:hypothetical protein BDFB_013531 [Asbolus verrucosus]|uniref:Uncharacterized protein n=1 Tax=Asbolus verrucosus TaxID=1661398 RepID=A0A482VFJ0_ASBVE|nr:hypothetical protein BDFB_013531 [Asbolus verrucosus]